MQFDFSQLRNSAERVSFYGDVHYKGLNTVDPVWWSGHRLLSYISYLSWGMSSYITDGMDEGSEKDAEANAAVRLAADIVFEGYNNFIRVNCVDPGLPSEANDFRIRGLDQLIRVAHGIDPMAQPTDHNDPIVASFYATFRYRLPTNISNARYEPFGGYYPREAPPPSYRDTL